ncbi:MAG TPA: hemolysin family protein [Bacteroidales bacterium]|nr:hemolysin family protein [Bacteroidales bacterium]
MNNFITIAIITMICSAFFSGMEIAFISANKLKIELDKKNRLFSGRLLSGFQKNPSDFVSTMLLGNTVTLVIYGIAMSHLLENPIKNILPESLRTDFTIMIIQTLVSTLLILFVGEFAPKAIFRINPNRVLKFFAFPLFIFYYILFPVQFIFVEISEFILQYIFRVKLKTEKYQFNHSDLDHYVKEFIPSEPTYENQLPEMQMFQNAIDFTHTRVRECMVPRNEIAAIEESDSIAELIKKFVNTGHSKILVYKKHIDNIIGYVHSYDMFSNPQDIKSINKPIIIVPQTMLAKDILPMFIQQHKSVAVVVDEFGGTSGMVTLEDLIEEITGEINDEFDDASAVEKQINEHEYIFSGRLEIDYLNDKYMMNLPTSDEYETLAGYIIHYLERIPAEKEKIHIPPFDITIIKASNKRIEQIHIVMTGDEKILA